MQQPSWKLVKVGILFGMLGFVLVLGPIGCSNNDNDPCSGVKLPAKIPFLALSDTLTETRYGARLVLSYDSTTNAFHGTMENTTGNTLGNVSVEVYLSGENRFDATALDPPALSDLAPGQVVDITLPAGSQPFTSWGAHVVEHPCRRLLISGMPRQPRHYLL